MFTIICWLIIRFHSLDWPWASVRNKLCRIAKCDALLNICDSVLHACSIKMRRQKNLFFLLFHTKLHHQKLSRTNLQRIGIYLPKISTKKYDKKSFQLSTRFVFFFLHRKGSPQILLITTSCLSNYVLPPEDLLVSRFPVPLEDCCLQGKCH